MVRVLVPCLASVLVAGCGSPASEVPAVIPPAPQEASKASAQAFFGKKMAPQPAAPKK